MEFRIFLPRLFAEDSLWMESESAARYERVLLSLISAFGGLDNLFPDTREDIYLVGLPHFGIKFRAGKKLEMKIRCKKLDFNIEHWKKVKLGKKKISHYKDEILALIASDSDQQLPDDAKFIDAESFIGVQKARRTQLLGETSKEICMISTNASDRLWVSFAFEGSFEVLSSLFSSTKLQPLSDLALMLEALQVATEIARSNLKAAVKSGFLPVAAGYPTWVRMASNNVTESEIFKDVDSLLLSVGCNINCSSISDNVPVESGVLNTTADSEGNECCFKIC